MPRIAAVLVVSAVTVPAAAWPPVLQDPELPSVDSESFPLDPALAPAVRFWAELFVKHDSSRVVLHDRQYLEIVWEVIDLPQTEDGRDDPAVSQKLIRDATESLRVRLRRLEQDPTPVDEDDLVILSLAGGNDPSRLPGAWNRIRAQRGVADRFRVGLAHAKPHLAGMQQILAEEGVPPEIAALPFVESMFTPTARSSVGALGIWQLMPATARSLGLKVGRGDDERTDIIKATRAAAKMLKKNYQMLGTWPLAITAYNHGPNGVRRAVARVGSTDLVYLIDNYEKATWGFASKNFYAEFLAATAVLADHDADFAKSVRAALLAAPLEPPPPELEETLDADSGPEPDLEGDGAAAAAAEVR
ncbi:MAG: lytic transglycosylase domain-containing protein [Deltaproteobacteria bacterium]|nr:lytic transglycosylase domain-containing protein [Deltaproteobacteria bacterium]